MSETASPERTNRRAPSPLWQAVRVVLCTLFDIFGAPEEVAARHTFTLKQHQLLLPWLRAVEALMRRMLLIEAALINDVSDPLPARERKIAQQSGEGQGPRAVLDPLPTSPVQGEESQPFDAARPESWRVSFRSMGARAPSPALRSTHKERAGEGARAPQFYASRPLAERMEALLRVFNDPAAYAKRLARRLRARSALAERVCVSWKVSRNLVGRTLFDALSSPVTNAARVFDST